jgi:hypothetical protein
MIRRPSWQGSSVGFLRPVGSATQGCGSTRRAARHVAGDKEQRRTAARLRMRAERRSRIYLPAPILGPRQSSAEDFDHDVGFFLVAGRAAARDCEVVAPWVALCLRLCRHRATRLSVGVKSDCLSGGRPSPRVPGRQRCAVSVAAVVENERPGPSRLPGWGGRIGRRWLARRRCQCPCRLSLPACPLCLECETGEPKADGVSITEAVPPPSAMILRPAEHDHDAHSHRRANQPPGRSSSALAARLPRKSGRGR